MQLQMKPKNSSRSFIPTFSLSLILCVVETQPNQQQQKEQFLFDLALCGLNLDFDYGKVKQTFPFDQHTYTIVVLHSTLLLCVLLSLCSLWTVLFFFGFPNTNSLTSVHCLLIYVALCKNITTNIETAHQ